VRKGKVEILITFGTGKGEHHVGEGEKGLERPEGGSPFPRGKRRGAFR